MRSAFARDVPHLHWSYLHVLLSTHSDLFTCLLGFVARSGPEKHVPRPGINVAFAIHMRGIYHIVANIEPKLWAKWTSKSTWCDKCSGRNGALSNVFTFKPPSITLKYMALKIASMHHTVLVQLKSNIYRNPSVNHKKSLQQSRDHAGIGGFGGFRLGSPVLNAHKCAAHKDFSPWIA